MANTGANVWAIPGLLAALALLAWVAASLSAYTQARSTGANAALNPLRELVRLLAKQRSSTLLPDIPLWRLGPALVLLVPILAATVIPIAPGIAVADLSIGLVWWTAMMALLWVGVFMTGWGANSPYPMIGGYRYVAQALAYEMPLAIVVITIALPAESLQLSEIVERQSELGWFVLWAPAGFLVYLIAAAAMAFWGPFSTPTANDLGGGVLAELSGVDRLLFLLGRYLVLVVAAAFAVPVFLGGHHGPLLPGWLWLLVKTLAMLALLVWARQWLPRIRIDRFEEFAWVVLIPLTLVQLFVVAGIVLLIG